MLTMMQCEATKPDFSGQDNSIGVGVTTEELPFWRGTSV
jgi:hypothetical protein